MMLAPVVVAAAALSPRFAPPLDVVLRYRTTETRPIAQGAARIVLRQTLRFARDGAGYRATTLSTAHEVDAPEPYRSLIEAPLTPFEGVATQARLDPGGAIVAVVDGAQTWARVQSAHAAQLERIDRDPGLSASARAAARAIIATTLGELAPTARDARLADSVAALLAPALPALAVGERLPFTAGAKGQAPAGGTVALVAADERALTYRIETRTDPAAGEAALAALRARLATATPDERARIEAAIAAARGTIDLRTTELQVERATGLLLSARTGRVAQAADGTRRPVGTSEIVLER